jgi:LacI family transcriptional regulator
MGRGITIEDVARAASVSRQTVSRVINHSPRVSPEAKARVQEAIADLGYVPSLAARSMGGGRSGVLLALFPETLPEGSGARELGRLLLAGAATCSAQGYRLLFEPLPADAEGAASRLAAAISAVQPEGVILLPPFDRAADLRAVLERRGIAHAALPRWNATASNPGEAAARRLIELGHRQIGYISGPGDPERSHQWLAGYRRALAQSGSRAHRHFVAENGADLSAALDLARAWLVPTIRPTALIVERADTALAVLHVARSLKLAVPKDLSLIALADDPALAACDPPVAVLHRPVPALFAAACDRLIPALRTGEDAAALAEPPLELTLELIDRPSIARAPRAI